MKVLRVFRWHVFFLGRVAKAGWESCHLWRQKTSASAEIDHWRKKLLRSGLVITPENCSNCPKRVLSFPLKVLGWSSDWPTKAGWESRSDQRKPAGNRQLIKNIWNDVSLDQSIDPPLFLTPFVFNLVNLTHFPAGFRAWYFGVFATLSAVGNQQKIVLPLSRSKAP